jgi:hypothetical protein
MSAGIGIALLLRFSSMLSFLYRTRSQIALFQKVARYLLKKAGKRPEGLSFDHIFRGNLTALARGASVGTVRIIPEILRRYVASAICDRGYYMVTLAAGSIAQDTPRASLPQGVCMGILITFFVAAMFASGYNLARKNNASILAFH